MASNINQATANFESNLTTLIGNCGLPVVIVRLELEKMLENIRKLEVSAIYAETDTGSIPEDAKKDESKVN